MRAPNALGIDALVALRAGRLPLDEPAFVSFYAHMAGPLKGYLRRLTGNIAVAEDLLQDSFVRFLAASGVPDDPNHQKNYLFRIATNLARDHYRRERRPVVAPPPVILSSSAGESGDVWVLLRRLSPRDRELLVLAYVEGFTHREIAGVTGLVRASVKPLLFRARRRFAAALQQAGYASPASQGSAEVSS